MAKKNYFTISEIAKEFNVKKSHIRSHEKKGLILPGNDKLGRRIYNQHDRVRLELIFHFMHIDYSPDQISELIGPLDVNMNKMEQFRKSLEYGEKKLDELEKRSKEIKFPDRISVINETKMMRNYIEELKNIEPLISVTEEKPKQKRIRMIPVTVGLSVIILFIASYFFYQGGPLLNFAQKKPSEAEASPVCRYPVPPENTGDQQNVASESSMTPDSPLAIQGGDRFTQESKDTIIDVEGSESSPEQQGLEVLQETAPLEESESVKEEDEAILNQRTESPPVLTAGLCEIGTKPDTPATPDDNELESKKVMDKKLSGIGETGRTENEDIATKLKHLESNGTQLSPVSIASDEKKQTDYNLSTASDVKKTKLNTDQNNQKNQNYTVSLHYTNDENREIVEELAVLLKSEGFDILGIEKVNYQYRDIRYFHDEDKPGALFLQKISNKSFTRFMNIEDMNIKIKNLSNKYPNARKGVLELWVNL